MIKSLLSAIRMLEALSVDRVKTKFTIVIHLLVSAIADCFPLLLLACRGDSIEAVSLTGFHPIKEGTQTSEA
jgi:hypothetical protein